ncbi:hypothetical protein C3747_197g54 [Trypanosoma cruzi]|uniref:Sperm microtubule inner protein 1 C-terminal domain-containing protein n=2 Tax=Trypanosoma cruzi TaxID=5693 RepID=Q4CMA4_TRYCC|nr:hypothetical protein, conserved [Trypanosoma cruzi]EAN81404.1 hypothetical protein, conserved [Trypanosoma cruzi]PWV01286.1 hypothetical protein C3747_197g54 [Trypanosoma cruzi]|eukprot:XP_802850.1 hypothetical protein [Trypanosoma cruzi strain CL Brener]
MTSKKKFKCPSVNPQLYEKSMKPSVTIAMGFKTSHGASSCWQAQVEAEERIHSNWSKKYNKDEEKRRVEALERTLEREADRIEVYRKDNDALQTILFRNDGVNPRGAAAMYLKARNALSPQEKYKKPQTSAQDIGWSVPLAMKSEGHFAASRLLNSAARMNQLATAYRRPDDADHAELFGYSFERPY